MKKLLGLSLLIAIGLVSCNNHRQEIDRLEIAKQYYRVLDRSDEVGMALLLTDSLTTRETQYNYQQTFSRSEYIEWLKWDAVFDPTYKVLEIEQEGDLVKATVAKTDKRIVFLHQEPIVTSQVIRFDRDKIIGVETTAYITFDDSTFVKNRDGLIKWIDQNHPELSGFIHDQTRSGGLKYLKAIELYQKQN
jgi:hypothetical protein